MSSKYTLENILSKLLDVVEKRVAFIMKLEPTTKVGKTTRYTYYCPTCLYITTYSKSQLDYMKKKGTVPKCSACSNEMKPIDNQFKTEVVKTLKTFYEVCKKVLQDVWEILETWWHGISRVNVCYDEVTVFFDYPSSMRIYLDKSNIKVSIYLYWLYEQKFEKFVELLSKIRNTGLHGEVRVDGRSDHCKIPEEKMRELGFKRLYEIGGIFDDWYIRF